ncbi:MAG: ATP-binding protein [Clostridia bacterium]|nr:ATP-binding protein [Clostridia bacterium]
MGDLNLLSEHYELYFNAAKKAEQKGDYFLAKRNYQLAAQKMLEMAKESSPQLKEARMTKAKRLIEIANSFDVNGMPKKKAPPSNDNKGGNTGNSSSTQDNNGKDWKAAKIPDISFDDIAGLDEVKRTITIRMINPLKHPEAYQLYGKKTGGGVLLYGPPGTGKTMIAKAIAHEVGAVFYAIKASDIVSKWVGESEQNINSLFEAASKEKLAIIFIDEMDNLFGTRGNDIHNDQRVNEFLQQIDGFAGKNPNLLLLGATNRPWAIDSAAVRSGRFSEKIYIPLPDFAARRYLFTRGLKNDEILDGIDFDVLAERSYGYSGADITEIIDSAKIEPLNEFIKTGNKVKITMAHMEKAFSKVKPSVSRSEIEVFDRFAGVNTLNEEKRVQKPTETPVEQPVETPVEPVVETPKEEPIIEVKTEMPKIIFAETTIQLNPAEKPKIEFYIEGDFNGITVKIDGKRYTCSKRIQNWITEELEITESGSYILEIYAEKLINKTEITFTKGIIENELF